MAEHVAILKWPYIRLILDGCKTMESRLTKTNQAPYGQIKPGEKIYFKASAGPYMAAALAYQVHFFDRLTPQQVASLRRRYNAIICGEPDYWRVKRDSRFATLISLRGVRAVASGPRLTASRGLAWFVFEKPDLSRVFEVALTDGAIRNRYVHVSQKIHRFPLPSYGGQAADQAGRDITLILPDGCKARTDLIAPGRIRWRGWGPYFQAHQMAPGDLVRFEQITARQYRVSFIERYTGPRRQA